MAEASKNLTPVALELGGETGNWCIVRKDADLKDAALKIAFFKLCNAGQKCAAEADQYRDRIIFGGVGNREKFRYAPTLIYPVDFSESIVQHELFCPLLPIVPYPFNGTGHSGMGAYHGEWGFRERRDGACTVSACTVSTCCNLPLREHPYNGKSEGQKLSILRWFER